MAINPGVAEIQEKRRKLLVGLDANEGFEKGLRDSAIDQYAGKCHFIYELLQNAADAGASEVEFTLSHDSLEFRHNGPRQFLIEDVNSITNYHQSAENYEESETIGKFGMGFKSVFFYTTTPEIHSGDYHFRITRMFYPETRNVQADECLNGWTKFTFPFGHPQRTVSDIFDEVKEGLCEIRGETLLFLRKIRKIECLLDDGRHLQIERNEYDHIVRIHRKIDGKDSSLYFLKFTKNILVSGHNLEIGIAYGLEPGQSTAASGDISAVTPDRFSIKPMRGKVFVYFPAEKEISNLQFHINAPFATPMSRESLTENVDNELVLRELAYLTVESLPFLRDNGLLRTETLAVFPIDKDQLPQKYLCFQRSITNAFNTHDLTPTKSGGFKRADRLMRSENRMSDLFSDEDMVRIYRHYTAPVWVKAAMTHKREDDFLSELDLHPFGNGELKALVTDGDTDESVNFLKLIDEFDDKRMCDLYKKVADIDVEPKRRYGGGWSLQAIFRATDGKLYHGYELYLGREKGAGKFLKQVYKEDDPRLIAFFKEHGVKEFNCENVLRECLRTVTFEVDDVALEHHRINLELLLLAFKKDPNVCAKFADFPWLCEDTSGRRRLLLAKCILLDEPYEKTGMLSLRKAYSNKYVISNWYREKLSNDDLLQLCKIMQRYDFIRSIRETYVEDSSYYFSISGHPRQAELDLPWGRQRRDPWYRDCKIEGIDGLCKCIDESISLRLWQLLMSLHGSGWYQNPFKAICHYSGSCNRTADSLLVCGLQSHAWLKGVDGRWYMPGDLTFSTLDKMYEPRDNCDGLRAVGFGVRATQIERANSEKQQEIDRFIHSTGAANENELREAVEMMREAKKHGIDIKGQILKKQAEAEMPENASINMDRRQQRAREDYAEAAEQTWGIRERSVKTSISMEPQARERLLRDYTDDARQMRCQLCREPMPFNKRNGQPYFECVQIFPKMKKETPDKYLALCPTCCAAYDEWIRKLEMNSERLRAEILSREVKSGQGAVSILLPDHGTPDCPVSPTKGMALYFVAPHFADLKVVLEGDDL